MTPREIWQEIASKPRDCLLGCLTLTGIILTGYALMLGFYAIGG